LTNDYTGMRISIHANCDQLYLEGHYYHERYGWKPWKTMELDISQCSILLVYK